MSKRARKEKPKTPPRLDAGEAGVLAPLPELDPFVVGAGAPLPLEATRDERERDALVPARRAERMANVAWYAQRRTATKINAAYNIFLASLPRGGRPPLTPPFADAIEYYLITGDLASYNAAMRSSSELVYWTMRNHAAKFFFAIGYRADAANIPQLSDSYGDITIELKRVSHTPRFHSYIIKFDAFMAGMYASPDHPVEVRMDRICDYIEGNDLVKRYSIRKRWTTTEHLMAAILAADDLTSLERLRACIVSVDPAMAARANPLWAAFTHDVLEGKLRPMDMGPACLECLAQDDLAIYAELSVYWTDATAPVLGKALTRMKGDDGAMTKDLPRFVHQYIRLHTMTETHARLVASWLEGVPEVTVERMCSFLFPWAAQSCRLDLYLQLSPVIPNFNHSPRIMPHHSPAFFNIDDVRPRPLVSGAQMLATIQTVLALDKGEEMIDGLMSAWRSNLYIDATVDQWQHLLSIIPRTEQRTYMLTHMVGSIPDWPTSTAAVDYLVDRVVKITPISVMPFYHFLIVCYYRSDKQWFERMLRDDLDAKVTAANRPVEEARVDWERLKALCESVTDDDARRKYMAAARDAAEKIHDKRKEAQSRALLQATSRHHVETLLFCLTFAMDKHTALVLAVADYFVAMDRYSMLTPFLLSVPIKITHFFAEVCTMMCARYTEFNTPMTRRMHEVGVRLRSKLPADEDFDA